MLFSRHVRPIRWTSLLLLGWLVCGINHAGAEPSQPFGPEFPDLDSDATGQWWMRSEPSTQQPRLMVPREEVIAFGIYTHDRGTLKLTAQLYPLLDGESREVRLELMPQGESE